MFLHSYINPGRRKIPLYFRRVSQDSHEYTINIIRFLIYQIDWNLVITRPKAFKGNPHIRKWYQSYSRHVFYPKKRLSNIKSKRHRWNSHTNSRKKWRSQKTRRKAEKIGVQIRAGHKTKGIEEKTSQSDPVSQSRVVFILSNFMISLPHRIGCGIVETVGKLKQLRRIFDRWKTWEEGIQLDKNFEIKVIPSVPNQICFQHE